MTNHVLFDFFGTLVDYTDSRTEQGYEGSFALIRDMGIDLDYAGFLSLWSTVSHELDVAAESSHREYSMEQVSRAFLERARMAEVGDRLVLRLAASYLAEWNRGVRYLAGLPELLERLAPQYTLAVITNTHDPGLVPAHLERMGVSGRFCRVFTSVECGWRKPGAEIFQQALQALDVSPRDCVYVGDNHQADYVGAVGVGIRPLLIDPRGMAPIPPEARLGSIFDLEASL